jgi:hypothetical protein
VSIRCNFFFSNGRYGWSETLYPKDPTVDLNAALTLAINYANIRVQLLGFGAQMDEIRVSDDTKFRDDHVTGLLSNTSSIFTGNNTPVFSSFAIQPYNDVVERCETIDGQYRKTLFLSGYPQYLNVNPWPGVNDLRADANFGAPFLAWEQELRTNWGFKVTPNPIKSSPNLFYPIVGAIVIDDFTVQLQTIAGSVIPSVTPPLNIVRVAFLKMNPRTPRIHGNLRVTASGGALPANAFNVASKNHIGQLFDPTGTGGYWFPQPFVVGIGTTLPEGFSEHRRGRPFGGPRGRRKPT